MSTFNGFIVTITGKLTIGSRDEVQKIIESRGGTFSKTLKKGVTHLVTNNVTSSSSKLTKAKAMGVKIVHEDFLNNSIQSLPSPQSPQSSQSSQFPRPTAATAKKTLNGMLIAITGKLMLPRSEYEKIIHANGGVFSSTVTKKVTHLIAANPDSASSKLEKARKNGTKIIGESFFEGLNSNVQVQTSLQPNTDMKEGDTITVDGSSGNTYEVRLRGGIHYCTCPAWRNAGGGTIRTCKHLRKILGDEYEEERVGNLPNVISNKVPAPKLLLAKKWDENKDDPTGWWISEKYDGLRGFWNGTEFRSRLGNKFYAPEYFTKDFPKTDHLDGELFLGRKQFEDTVSIVKSQNTDDDRWENIKFMVFDITTMPDSDFETRVKYLNEHISKCKYIEIVKHEMCKGKDSLITKREEIEKKGGEGLMLRKPNSKYVGTRSSTLLKVKSFSDDEAIIIGAGSRGKGKFANMVGSLKVRNAKGVEFFVGSGLSKQQRMNPPKTGTIITYKYQELTKAGVPRFPTFLKIADNQTWPSKSSKSSK